MISRPGASSCRLSAIRPAAPSATDRRGESAMTPLEMTERLVGFDTVSAKSNLQLIEYVRDYLRDQGVAARIVPNESGTKANLFATIGPDIPGGIALSGHTDVVPVEGQPWTSDPFTLTRRDGRVYGRGS